MTSPLIRTGRGKQVSIYPLGGHSSDQQRILQTLRNSPTPTTLDTLLNPQLQMNLSFGCALLAVAIKSDALGLVKYILEKARILVNSGYGQYQSPQLTIAINHERFEIIKELVRLHVQINLVDKHGRTALTIAVEKNNPNLAHYLIKKGGVIYSPLTSFIQESLNPVLKAVEEIEEREREIRSIFSQKIVIVIPEIVEICINFLHGIG